MLRQFYCQVCLDVSGYADMLVCRCARHHCGVRVHEACYYRSGSIAQEAAASRAPVDKTTWMCETCAASKRDQHAPHRDCASAYSDPDTQFACSECPERNWALSAYADRWTHPLCEISAAGVACEQAECVYCERAGRRLARCAHPHCDRRFHALCFASRHVLSSSQFKLVRLASGRRFMLYFCDAHREHLRALLSAEGRVSLLALANVFGPERVLAPRAGAQLPHVLEVDEPLCAASTETCSTSSSLHADAVPETHKRALEAAAAVPPHPKLPKLVGEAVHEEDEEEKQERRKGSDLSAAQRKHPSKTSALHLRGNDKGGARQRQRAAQVDETDSEPEAERQAGLVSVDEFKRVHLYQGRSARYYWWKRVPDRFPGLVDVQCRLERRVIVFTLQPGSQEQLLRYRARLLAELPARPEREYEFRVGDKPWDEAFRLAPSRNQAAKEQEQARPSRAAETVPREEPFASLKRLASSSPSSAALFSPPLNSSSTGLSAGVPAAIDRDVGRDLRVLQVRTQFAHQRYVNLLKSAPHDEVLATSCKRLQSTLDSIAAGAVGPRDVPQLQNRVEELLKQASMYRVSSAQ